ncbi:MAG: bifunctional heptose 7-phosphate kinase/heptose 1-phosphate adenyltransferase [Opitutales bacterium]
MPPDIEATLHKFAGLKILVLGDVMLDHYIFGDATRISPEAPVPVVSVARDSYVPGGAANVAGNLAGLGVPTTLLGSYCDDPEGRRLRTALEGTGIALSPLGETAAPTILKTRVVVQRQQLCRLDREAKPNAYHLEHLADRPEFAELIRGADAVLFSDYAKGVLSDPLLRSIREIAAGMERPPLLAMDPKPSRRLDLSGLGLLTPNRGEALRMAGFHDAPDADFDDEAVCRAILRTYRPERLVITLGAEGMLLVDRGEILGRIETEAREVFDVSGAGDTVVATLTAALAAGLPLSEAAALANRAAGIVVGHLGTRPISSAELLASR